MGNGAVDEKEEWRPQPSKKRKRKKLRPLIKEDLSIPFELLEFYVLRILTWEEAKPFVDLLEKIYGLFPPKRVSELIEKILRKFDQKLYGRDIKTDKVVFPNAKFDSLNKITGNKRVNVK